MSMDVPPYGHVDVYGEYWAHRRIYYTNCKGMDVPHHAPKDVYKE
jgi:hypothetical protein